MTPNELSNPPTRFSRYRWVIIGLLFFATTINYLDRQILALLKPMLDTEIGWTNAEYGYINAAFQATYALSYLGVGWLIDKLGIKLGYSLSVIFWSVAALAHSFVGSVRGFMFARIALGVGEGGNFPASIKTVACWFPQKERAFAASIFNSGSNVAAVIGPFLVPFIAFHFGWQMCFIFAGSLGFVWLLFWLPLFNNQPSESRFVSTEEANYIDSDKTNDSNVATQIRWSHLFRLRQTWAIVLTKFLTDPVWWFFLIWLPDFFKKTRDLDLKSSWPYLVWVYAIATVFSLFGGWLSGYFIQRGWSVSRARKTAMFIFAISVIPVVFAPQVNNIFAVVLIGAACAAHQAWTATIYASTSDMFPKSSIAAISGIAGMAGAFGGMLFPIITGILLDHYKQSTGGETAGYAILFTYCGAAYVIAFLVNHLLAPKFTQIQIQPK